MGPMESTRQSPRMPLVADEDLQIKLPKRTFSVRVRIWSKIGFPSVVLVQKGRDATGDNPQFATSKIANRIFSDARLLNFQKQFIYIEGNENIGIGTGFLTLHAIVFGVVTHRFLGQPSRKGLPRNELISAVGLVEDI